ncbi:MAG: IS200/IS605 family transposase [Candidatus Pacearchaeota archaeon]|nr:IS200/IS605 family transposase [Candidatus Pacearchaeota archaeon]
MDVEHAGYSTYRIRYHMVFVVKYRKQMLLKKVPFEYFKKIIIGIGERYWFKFDAIGVEEDHFHIVVGAAPRYSPSRVMQIIKSITAKKIFEDYPDIKEFLWGGNFWSAGGHIDTVSEFGGLEKIKKYVEEQGRNKGQLTLATFV